MLCHPHAPEKTVRQGTYCRKGFFPSPITIILAICQHLLKIRWILKSVLQKGKQQGIWGLLQFLHHQERLSTSVWTACSAPWSYTDSYSSVVKAHASATLLQVLNNMWSMINCHAEATAIITGCFKIEVLCRSESNGTLRTTHAGVYSLLASWPLA